MNKKTPSYYAVIPAEVRYDHELPPGARLLYGELTALSSAHGFAWASNRYFAELYRRDEGTISAWVSALAERGHIRVELEQGEAGITRKIYVNRPALKGESAPPSPEKSVGGMPKNPVGVSRKISRPYPEKSVVNNKEIIVKENEESAEAAPPLSTPSPSELEAERLALLLLEEHRRIDPKFRPGSQGERSVKTWAPAIERLSRIDGRSAPEVEAAIYWCQHDDFWQSNILSGEKLREKFPTLVGQMKRGTRGQGRNAPPPRRELPAAPSQAAQEAAARVDAAIRAGEVD